MEMHTPPTDGSGKAGGPKGAWCASLPFPPGHTGPDGNGAEIAHNAEASSVLLCKSLTDGSTACSEEDRQERFARRTVLALAVRNRNNIIEKVS